ncbi:hypothetical protein DLM75_10025 [Leptospira stimsonii]|uniref:Uncharacterized protein n=1 Tax=Leptospira stimsonii TaxID=2202203 RepID=A0A396ZAI6_9LEPT|nr:hypothetical protein DLM75_10025 [Leptospira stimsonii]
MGRAIVPEDCRCSDGFFPEIQILRGKNENELRRFSFSLSEFESGNGSEERLDLKISICVFFL